jgi:hypothetical protein
VITHYYRPRGNAVKAFRDRSPEVVLSGPAGTGKSRALLEKIHAMALRNPDMAGLLTRRVGASLAAAGLRTYENWVAKEALGSGEVTYFGGSSRLPPAYRYSNGATLTIGGLDKPEKIMSTEYDVAYVQEATELDLGAWETITARLRNGRVSFQQVLADCNPSHPLHWLKLRSEQGVCTMYDTVHEDNPVYFDEVRGSDGLIEYKITKAGAAYIDKLDRLTGVRYLRLRKGLWVAAEGVIYEEYDPRHHLVDWFEPPAHWDRVWAIDFGYTNPFCLQRWAIDPDGRMWLYREHYGTRRLVEDWTRIVLDDVSDPDPGAPDDLGRRIWREPKPKAVLCDHDAEGRATFERHSGLWTLPAAKGVATGIEWMQARFRIQSDGKARVYFMKDARVMRDQELVDARKPTCTVEELPAYIWDRGVVRVEGATEHTLKEVPLKRDDHGMDPMRYVGNHLGVPIRLEIGIPGGGAGGDFRMPTTSPYG